jgi:predicted AAA+ superfamily ATPase
LASWYIELSSSRNGNPASSSARGRLFAQWVILECLRQIDYSNDEARLYYWRTNTGAEVDLLLEKHGELRLAVDIKSRETISGADVTGLRSFADAHPKVPCAVVCLAPHEHQLGETRVMPYQTFLRTFDRWL